MEKFLRLREKIKYICRSIEIEINLNLVMMHLDVTLGFTHDYIDINADYRN